MVTMKFNYLYLVMCIVTRKVCCENKNKTAGKNVVQNIQKSLALEVLWSTLNTTTNTVVSVLPLQFTLCKLASVATGKAREELFKTLGFQNESMIHRFFLNFREIILLLQQADLTYLNKIYLDYNKPIEMSFVKNSTSSYGVQMQKVGYNFPSAATNFINKEIASATYRRVENVLIPNDVTNVTSMLLVTAGHFKPTWEDVFNYKQTNTRMFQMPDHTRVEIPMMYSFEECYYYDARDFKVVTKRLMANQCSMTFIQPDFLPLEKILEKLKDPNFMKTLRKNMVWKYVRIIMPRLKIKSRITLNEHFEKLGIKEILNKNTTGFNGILSKSANGSNMFVSKVVQQFFFEADEYGVSRVVRDMFDTEPPREHPNSLEVVLDRPFYFTVNVGLDHTDIYELFNGVYYKPDVHEIRD